MVLQEVKMWQSWIPAEWVEWAYLPLAGFNPFCPSGEDFVLAIQ